MGDRIVRQRVVVTGRVQGVWFRVNTERIARSFGLSGWVRNRSDGSVEAVFEGSPEAVKAAARWCERGPERAHVERVELFDEPPEGLPGFMITE